MDATRSKLTRASSVAMNRLSINNSISILSSFHCYLPDIIPTFRFAYTHTVISQGLWYFLLKQRGPEKLVQNFLPVLERKIKTELFSRTFQDLNKVFLISMIIFFLKNGLWLYLSLHIVFSAGRYACISGCNV